MNSTNEYAEHFFKLTGRPPFEYQIAVARLLMDGRNITLRAPTGAGKTMAVLAPFLFPGWRARPFKLIYALPLRTLAQGVYTNACACAAKLGKTLAPVLDESGREKVSPFVTLQTGEQPDDRFFDRGTIIVTTYDQVLSGLLEGPYGLSHRLHNVNAAAIAGALVVFDEFHLMPPQRAFLTAVAGLKLFERLCQSVWMTATATEPLQEVLRDALNTVTVPGTPAEAEELNQSLPSIRKVTRNLVVESESLNAATVLKFFEGRSIVLANTVGRAQALYADIADELTRRGSKIPHLLLHSRFFKQDRQAKEARLRLLFGPESKGPAILVATQVIEAGIDISCEHLHTELCPMNSLVQRTGRCARFPGESGTVHVHPLPDAVRNWLPYGDTAGEDLALAQTRDLLATFGTAPISPTVAAQWVEAVHREEDAQAIRGGWPARLTECLERIRQTAVLRQPQGIAALIRGEDTDSVRVIIARADNLPETPAEREAVSLTRWSLSRIVRGNRQVGWFWDGSDETPWKPLRGIGDLGRTYALCLTPETADYTEELGLVVGTPGAQESPLRKKIPSPGYAPLHAESWVHHSRCVAETISRRIEQECPREGFLSSGFFRVYGLDSHGLLEAARTCAHLHDLGKLQEQWQQWAEAVMRAAGASYIPETPLAHTDFDPFNPRDRQRENEVSKTFPRPAHAPASAFYASGLIAQLLKTASEENRPAVASACLAAVLAHHGGWLPDRAGPGLAITRLVAGWERQLSQVAGPTIDSSLVQRLWRKQDRSGLLSKLLQITIGPDEVRRWWPLVSYLTRALRLSDQRATAEGHNHD